MSNSRDCEWGYSEARFGSQSILCLQKRKRENCYMSIKRGKTQKMKNSTEFLIFSHHLPCSPCQTIQDSRFLEPKGDSGGVFVCCFCLMKSFWYMHPRILRVPLDSFISTLSGFCKLQFKPRGYLIKD